MSNYYVTGIQRKTGSFNGREYDNYSIHCIVKDAAENLQLHVDGEAVTTFKLKTSMWGSVAGLINVDEIKGQTVDLSFDRYGNITSLRLVKKNG